MAKKRFANLILPILLSLFSITVGCASFIITIYDTNGVPNENAIPTVDKISQAEAYIDETGQYYASVEYALAAANLRNGKSTVYVIPGTNPVIDTPCIVGENVTLNFPYSEKNITNQSMGFSGRNEPYGEGFGSETPANVKNNVIIKTITDETGSIQPTIKIESGGVINIGGLRRSLAPESTTGLDCVVLIMDPGAVIDCYGTIYNYGFIKETVDYNGSIINVYNTGTIWQQLVIYDWSSGRANGNVVYPDPIAFPFNYFDSCQIAPEIKFYSGSYFKAMVWVFGTNLGDSYAEGTIIGRHGSGNDGLIQATEINPDYCISWKSTDTNSENNTLKNASNEDKNDHKVDVVINGNYNLESFQIELDVMGSIPLNIDSADYFVPFSNFFNLNILTGNINIQEKVKLLPGSSVIVGEDATVTFNNGFIILESAYNPNPNNSSQKIYYYDSTNSKVPAKFINNGTIIINSSFGGKIQASENGNTNSKIIVNNASSVTSQEIVAFGQIPIIVGGSDPTLFSVTDQAKADIANADGLISENTILSNNTIYRWKESNGSYCWEPVEKYQATFTILEPDEGLTNKDVNYTISVNGTKIYDNPTSLDVYEGDVIRFTNITNYEYVRFNDSNILDILDQEFVVGTSSLQFEIRAIQSVGHKVSFIIEDVVSQDGFYTFSPEFEISLNDISYFNPSELTIFEGDVLVINSMSNYKKVTFNGDEINPINYSHTFTDENIDYSFIITPETIEHTLLGSITLQYSDDGGRNWYDVGSEKYTFKTKVTLSFKVLIRDEGNNLITDYDDYTIEWTEDDNIIATNTDQIDNKTYTYAENANNDHSITVSVKDNITNKHEFSQTIRVILEDDGNCLLPYTLVNMADGSVKPVKDIVSNDMVKVFNHEEGIVDTAPIVFNVSDPLELYNVINLKFSNGKTIGIIYQHGFFDLDLNRYVYITETNYQNYIGHEFYSINSNGNSCPVTLLDAYIKQEYTKVYAPVSSWHLNYFIEDILSIPGGTNGLSNIFEYDENLKYDEELMKADIDKYGLFTYDDFKDLIPYEFYSHFPVPYLKVSIGKGFISYADILHLIERFSKYS